MENVQKEPLLRLEKKILSQHHPEKSLASTTPHQTWSHETIRQRLDKNGESIQYLTKQNPKMKPTSQKLQTRKMHIDEFPENCGEKQVECVHQELNHVERRF